MENARIWKAEEEYLNKKIKKDELYYAQTEWASTTTTVLFLLQPLPQSKQLQEKNVAQSLTRALVMVPSFLYV